MTGQRDPGRVAGEVTCHVLDPGQRAEDVQEAVVTGQLRVAATEEP